MKYYINGWQESSVYFFSFGFTEREIFKMKSGETLVKGNNEFRIEVIKNV